VGEKTRKREKRNISQTSQTCCGQKRHPCIKENEELRDAKEGESSVNWGVGGCNKKETRGLFVEEKKGETAHEKTGVVTISNGKKDTGGGSIQICWVGGGKKKRGSASSGSEFDFNRKTGLWFRTEGEEKGEHFASKKMVKKTRNH